MKKAQQIMPELKKLAVAKHDSLFTQEMINGAYRLVLNQYMNEVSDKIREDQENRNQVIAATYWFNPVTGFHNWLNMTTKTGHQQNLTFRRNIQQAGNQIHYRLTMDEWQQRKMDHASFREYIQLLALEKSAVGQLRNDDSRAYQ
jgi:Cft2 family RNA processing exonuclease